jgi:transposase
VRWQDLVSVKEVLHHGTTGAGQIAKIRVWKSEDRGSARVVPFLRSPTRTVERASSPHCARTGDTEVHHERRAIFVGMDISQACVDVAVHPGTAFQISHDERGIAEAVERLHAVQPTLIVLEATGGLEVPLTGRWPPPACRSWSSILVRCGTLPGPPDSWRRRIGSMPRSLRGSPRPFGHRFVPVPDEQTQALAALVARRRQLIEMLTAEKNRLRLAARPIQQRVQAHITWLEKELAATNTDLTATMRESPVWREKDEVLRSVPGVGPVLTTTLFANLPELSTLTRKEVAALAGVAPFPRDSGTLKGRHAIGGGRAHVRAALYMAALVATRRNPVIRVFYQRLCQAGQGKEASVDGLHAEAAHDSQCHDKKPNPVA